MGVSDGHQFQVYCEPEGFWCFPSCGPGFGTLSCRGPLSECVWGLRSCPWEVDATHVGPEEGRLPGCCFVAPKRPECHRAILGGKWGELAAACVDSGPQQPSCSSCSSSVITRRQVPSKHGCLCQAGAWARRRSRAPLCLHPFLQLCVPTGWRVDSRQALPAWSQCTALLCLCLGSTGPFLSQ